MSLKDIFQTAIGVGAVIVGAATGNLGLIVGGAALIGSTAVGALGTEQRQQGVQQETAGTEESMIVVYGRAKVASNVYETRVDPDSNERRYLVRGAAVCLGSQDGRGIEEIEEIQINGRTAVSDPVFSDTPTTQGVEPFWDMSLFEPILEYSAFDGSFGQSVPSELSTRFPSVWTSDHKGQGIAHVLIGATFHKEKYRTGLPRLQFIVKGQRVFDPRDDTWKYSENPWLCALDLITSRGYGKGAYRGLNSPEYWEEKSATGATVAQAFVDQPIGEIGLSEGQTVSCGWDLKSASGADRVRHKLVWKDSSGTTIRTDTSGNITSGSYDRAEIEGVDVPTDAATVSWIAENLDTTEQASARRAEFLKRRRAAPFLRKIDLDSFITQANYADDDVGFSVGGAPQTKTRHRVGGFIDTADDVDQNIQMLAGAGRGDIVFEGGRFRATVRKGDATPLDFTLTPDDLRGEWRVHRRGLQEAPNSIKVTYTDQDKEFQATDVIWPEEGDFTLLDANQGFDADVEMGFPMIPDAASAKQIGMIMLREMLQDTIFEGTAKHRALQLQTNDLIRLTLPTEGFDEKLFWVVGLQIRPEYRVQLVLHEFDADVYNLLDQSAEATVPSPDLPDPFSLDPVSALTLRSDQDTQQITPAGDKIPRIEATWTPPDDPFYDRAEVAARRTEDVDGNPVSEEFEALEPVLSGEEQRKLITRGREGETWEVKITAINTAGIRATPVTQEVLLDTDFVASDILGDVVDVDVQEDDFDGDGVVEGRMLVDVIDTGQYDLQFLTRQGQGTTWTNANNPTGISQGDPTEIQDVGLLEKANSFIALEVYKAGTNERVGRRLIVTFDPDTVAHVTNVGAWVRDDGTPGADAGGDSDTARIHVTFTLDGSKPPDPDPGAGNVDDTIEAREGRLVFSSETVSKGDVLRVRARGENGAGQLAPAGTTKGDQQGRSGTDTAVDIMTEVDFAATETRISDDLSITGSLGADGVGPVEVRYKVNDGAWTAWQAPPLTPTIQADTFNSKIVHMQARDSGLDAPRKSRSPLAVHRVDPILEGFDPGDGLLDYLKNKDIGQDFPIQTQGAVLADRAPDSNDDYPTGTIWVDTSS